MSDENTPTDGAEITTEPPGTEETNSVIDTLVETPVEDPPPPGTPQSEVIEPPSPSPQAEPQGKEMHLCAFTNEETGEMVIIKTDVGVFTSLSAARALPEAPKDLQGFPRGGPIKSFKDVDRRTMRIVLDINGTCFKQEV